MEKSEFLSVVVPVHNEEAGIYRFITSSLLPVLEGLKYKFELIIVNDGSLDNTLEIIRGIAKENGKIRILSLSRNFGKEAALTAGISVSKGDAIVTIDADGQQPPELIPEFIEKWKNGAEVVVGVRSHYSKHGVVQKAGSKLFYKLLRAMGNKTTVPGSTDFRLIDRVVAEEFVKFSEHNRISRGLIDWLGFKQEYVEFVYGVRAAGKPSYSLNKLFHLAIDSFVSMSTTPLAIFGYLGVFITIGSFLLGMFCIINQYFLGDPLGLYWNGSIQLAIFITFLIGLLMISQSITALYISHIHAETQNRPLFVVDKRKSVNIENTKWKYGKDRD